MTTKTYLDDSYLKECEAKVVKVTDGKFVVLDQTIFYPQGGGQPTDTGKLIASDGKEYKVVFAKQFGDEISHEVDREEGLKEGDAVKCILDWERRYAYMRMHTAAHLLAAVINKELNGLITGNQLGVEQSRMDFNVDAFSEETVKTIEEKTNAVIARNLEVFITYEDREKALQREELFKLKDVLPKDIDTFRIVAIGDYDIQADGGTHVKNTSEIGKIRVVNSKNKGKNNRRIYWELE